MGGDHKCPLCSATFTRPQHVGRHLRAHTGDRPYECKECPLRFARSDLLSRHVNKAHPKPNGVNDGNQKGEKKARSKSTSQAGPSLMAPMRPPPVVAPPTISSLPHQPEPTAYQAQRMYPNHPLLQQSGSAGWSMDSLDLQSAQFNIGQAGMLGADMSQGMETAPGDIAFIHPFMSNGYDPNLVSGYEFSSSMPNGSSMMGYELSVKKRACDQCNHSKVRCDFADPCARCSHRHIQCTYTKPQRARNMTYPVSNGAHLSTMPNAFPGTSTSPTAVFNNASPNMRPQPTGEHLNDRRNSDLMTASDFLTTDVGNRMRPPVPDPNWDLSTLQHRSHSISDSPPTLGFAMTPSLTNETSPSASESDHRGSQSSSILNNGNWNLPPGVVSHESAIKFVNSFVSQQNAESAVSHGNPQLIWPNNSGLDATMMPDSALSVTDDEADVRYGRRRRSSASLWANALGEMKLEDSNMPNMQLDPALEQMHYNLPPRHPTYPLTSEDLQHPGLSRGLSNGDNLWKLFLDTGALATPDGLNSALEMANEPARLNKSNSAPDLTTPGPHTKFPNPFEALGGDDDQDAEADSNDAHEDHSGASSDEDAMNRFKEQVSQRHASFRMNADAANSVRTRALTNAQFASSLNRQLRPSLHPLMYSAGGDATLAPERLPSFGPMAFDLNGVLLTPPSRMPKTPNGKFFEARPGNKRQASQTLIGDNLKRTVTLGSAEDSEESAPRRSVITNGHNGVAQWQTHDPSPLANKASP